jgi:hypothetical protein
MSRTGIARLQVFMPTVDDLRPAVVGCSPASMPFLAWPPFAFNGARLTSRLLTVASSRLTIPCFFGFPLTILILCLLRLIPLGAFTEDHLAQLFDGGIFRCNNSTKTRTVRKSRSIFSLELGSRFVPRICSIRFSISEGLVFGISSPLATLDQLPSH